MLNPDALPRAQQTLIGHQDILDNLKRNTKGAPCLLMGPKGVGKATLAYHYARFLFQSHPVSPPIIDGQVSAGSYPNLFVLESPNPSEAIPVDSVRSFVEKLRYKPAIPGWRVVMIDSLDQLNHAGLNALLKILEEPPSQTQFLLIAHRPTLPTIFSRCQRHVFRPLPSTTLKDALPNIGDFPLQFGTIKKALHFGKPETFNLYQKLIEWIEQSAKNDLSFLPNALKVGAEEGNYSDVLFFVPFILYQKAAQCGDNTSLWGKRWQAVASFLKDAENAHLDASHVIAMLFLLIESTS